MGNNREWIGTGISAVLTIVQTNEVFQIISLVLTILTTLLTFIFTIYKWIKLSKEDGKIDEDEIKQGIEIVEDFKESPDKISEEFNDNDKEDKKDKE